MICKHLYLFLSLISGMAFAQFEHHDRKIKSFPATDLTQVEVTNKHGKVHVINWQKDSVKFVIDFTALSKNSEKLEKLISSVRFDLTGNGDYIIAKTNITGETNLDQDFERLKRALSVGGSGNDVTINYKVYMPKGSRLIIDNKFGDVILADRAAKTDITLAHGDLKAGDFLDDVDLDISFGEGTIRSMTKDAKIALNHCDDFTIEKGKDLDIESRFSEYEVEEAVSIRLDSRKDDVTIGEVRRLTGVCTLPSLAVTHIAKELNLDSKMPGSLEIEEIDPRFTYINLVTRFTDVSLNFKPESSYNFDMKHKNVQFDYPRNIAKFNTEVIDDKKLQSTTGRVGVNAAGRVSIEAESCNVSISHY